MEIRIKKVFRSLFLAFVFLTLFSVSVYAEDIVPPVDIHLTITSNESSLYDQDISVDACNSANASTPDVAVTAYCAILQSGISSDWNWSWAPGAFLNSLGDLAGYTTKDKDNNDVYHYWSWYLNSKEGEIALNQYVLQSGDLILLNFIDPVEEPTPEPEVITSSRSSGSKKKTTLIEKPIFDTKKAFEFIISQQKENGSFGEDLYTDWIALALASGNYQDQTIKLVKYFGESKTTSALLTDFERHAMALMALGLNPYNTNGENYIGKITDSFDGKQFGDVNEDNDDIFALIVLQNAGYNQNEKMINNSISFVLSRQKESGSWDESVDMTGAGIEMLASFNNQNEQVSNALIKAKNFLKQNQKDNGGWNDSASSTAWALEGIFALSEKPEDWIKNDNTPFDYLATNQDTDGGTKDSSAEEEGGNIQNKIWETAYVTSVLSGKTWNQIMQKFENPQRPIAIEVPKEVAKEEEIKKLEINKITQAVFQEKKKLENLAVQNTAAPIMTTNDAPIKEKISEPIKKKSWLRILFDKIFSF